ncbi:MAG: hypothetical protein M3Y87_05950 [Myxococcota bacterium]|nr:hypothetical protein [Myxococcota bacterium]
MEAGVTCHRCGGALGEHALPGRGGGAYRSATHARACAACRISIVRAADLGTDFSLARSPAVRESETLHDRCPDCSTRLVRLTLGWDGGAEGARIEACPHCALLVFDAGELAHTTRILELSRALTPDAIERLLELAPSPDPEELRKLRG